MPRVAADYYGPNQEFRKTLESYPNSWKPLWREVTANKLTVNAKGGMVVENYPIRIDAKQDEIELSIEGEAGYVPLSFHGLKSPRGYTLYQKVKGMLIAVDQANYGNDFWQTDFNPLKKTYTITYNVKLDNSTSSTFVLKKHQLVK